MDENGFGGCLVSGTSDSSKVIISRADFEVLYRGSNYD